MGEVKSKYPTFQDKYGQLAPQDPTFEQNKSAQEDLNPWSAVMQQQAETGQDEPPIVQLAPRQWEYQGK